MSVVSLSNERYEQLIKAEQRLNIVLDIYKNVEYPGKTLEIALGIIKEDNTNG